MVITVLLAVATASAQNVTNVTAEQVNKTILVSYDLDKQADITLFLSTDGGSTYTQLYRVSGDVGQNVSAGHKTVVWDVLTERDKLVGDNIVFKVKAQGEDNLTFTVNGVTFKMIYVKGGTFMMGCPSKNVRDCYDSELPVHSVTLSDFYLGETEVTQALWKAVTGCEPDYNGGWTEEFGRGSTSPAYHVSWNECQAFCEELNSKLAGQLPSGYRFVLPTEAQWEYAARGGNKSRSCMYSGGNNVGSVAWYNNNCHNKVHPVKTKKANELGLYDMTGNIYEWCSDWYGSYSSVSQTDPKGPLSGTRRVLRGCCWCSYDDSCGVTFRGSNTPDHRFKSHGLRLSLVKQ